VFEFVCTFSKRLERFSVSKFVGSLSRLHTATTPLGDRAFAAAGQWMWKSLPAELRQPDLSLGR